MQRAILRTTVLAIALMVMASLAVAEVPQLINYQGRLTDEHGDPVPDFTYGITFTIYDAATDGNTLWTSGQQLVPVTNGLFHYQLGSVVQLPDTLFEDTLRWLGIKVGADPEVTPRTRFKTVPYAYHSLRADTALNGGKWTVIDSVLYTNKYWGIFRGGAGNVLYGDSGYSNVNLGVACTTGTATSTDPVYSTIAGGQGNTVWGTHCAVGGGAANTAGYGGSTIGGGANNETWGVGSTVGGGKENSALNWHSTVSGGVGNNANGWSSTVGGGNHDTASGDYSTVSGGINNEASGDYTAVCGGENNTASGSHSVVAGGHRNIAEGSYSSILGGYGDTITSTADYSYLFGIGSMLTEDSTFMVDMPHIRFGDETDGYEFPPSRGQNGEVMATDGNGQLSWVDGVGNGWKHVGDTVCLVDSTDRVGIGLCNPTGKLHVWTDGGKAVIGQSTGDHTYKYGGWFSALDSGSYNFGVHTVSGCALGGSQPASTANIALYAVDVSSCAWPSLPSGDWAGYFRGDVKVTGDLNVSGSISGSIKTQFDTSFSISAGQTKTITHGLGGHDSLYIVLVYGKSDDGNGWHQGNFGTSAVNVAFTQWIGLEWYNLNSNSITVERGNADNQDTAKDWDKVWIRIIKNQ